MKNIIADTENNRLYKLALGFALFTIIYNVAEGLISTYLGFEDESLALFGFGADSFIEVISGIGIAHMILRIQKKPESNKDVFERTALRITGFAFYTLVAALVFTSLYNIWIGHKPITTFWGVVISIVSIAIMWMLVLGKRKVGKELDSEPILSDANCTMVCVYMSIILLISSAFYELWNIPYIDSIGTLALSYFAFKEGKECFEKARSNKYCGCD
ncbi:cation transporter [Arenibacter sp. ARW7G5Y1]|uniref:cation transporter n=1 Tax=Arenibacter sp. ARW7G5Y1 TaxID=2135619 RepID=UPI000D75BA01|nr:cation transporter [Arenibacter sp. ARW7G5Y1]PXX25167.1 cation efflux family protein [Arenibacter sp. ARW7G5Y1]|tara:strand:- start:17428 stop:18075 length:648 start_codon:yes stop_codon:yes gene_type:complete